MTFDKYSSKRAPDLKTSNCSGKRNFNFSNEFIHTYSLTYCLFAIHSHNRGQRFNADGAYLLTG